MKNIFVEIAKFIGSLFVTIVGPFVLIVAGAGTAIYGHIKDWTWLSSSDQGLWSGRLNEIVRQHIQV